jgi:hypothetical protein
MYSYALEKENSIRLGVQTLRHSHHILSVEPVQVGHDRMLLMDRYVVEDLNGCYLTAHQPTRYPDNPILSGQDEWDRFGPHS